MWYAIISEDVENSLDLRIHSREAHLARLRTLADEGRILIAGPHPASDNENANPAGFTGSLVVADFPSLADARAWAEVDPYVDAGVYANVTIKPFKLVLP
ncbi:MAG: YciI family protein [Gammaproteobacteria bacterium]|nr:YciI family protein [Gammaproteobacteria bacterium]